MSHLEERIEEILVSFDLAEASPELKGLLREQSVSSLAFGQAKQRIKSLVADEMLGLLDRLESNKEELFWWTGGEYDRTTGIDMRAVAAERAKLADGLGK